MNRERVFTWVLIVLLLLLLYLSFLILHSFHPYIVLALVLAYLFHPLYRAFAKRMPHAIAATLLLVLIFILLLLPTAYIATKLVSESISAYNALSGLVATNDIYVLDGLFANIGLTTNGALSAIGGAVRDYFLAVAPGFLSSVAATVLGLFVMFFLMFYAFIDGERWVAAAKAAVPMSARHKARLFVRIEDVTYGVMYGQFLTAVIQGVAGGLVFFAFGVSNPVFWGFIMMILSFVPTLGTPLVWVPAAVLEFLNHQYVSGFGVLILGGAVLLVVDNVLRPRLISGRVKLSTPLVLLGVLGGLQLFGFVGLILGPLILALLQTTLAFFHETAPQKQRV